MRRPRNQAAPTASRKPCPARRWPAPGPTGQPTPLLRSAGGSATSGRSTALLVAHGRTSSRPARTRREAGKPMLITFKRALAAPLVAAVVVLPLLSAHPAAARAATTHPAAHTAA